MLDILDDDTAKFWKRFRELPKPIQDEAKEAYRIFKVNPHYPSLRYHTAKVRGGEELHSVSVTIHYRALARERNGELQGFWIGYHTVYDAILAGR